MGSCEQRAAGAVALADDAADAPPEAIGRANAMPAPTWGWLRMNEASIELPKGLAPAGRAAVSVDVLSGQAEVADGGEAFDAALARAAARYAAAQRPSMPNGAAGCVRRAEEESLDVPALSAYQAAAADREERYTPEAAFATGMGEEAFSYVRGLAGRPFSVSVAPGAQARVSVRVDGTDGAAAAGAIDVVVGAGAQLDLALAIDAPADGSGVVACSLRLFADDRAHARLSCVQTAGDGFTALDDTGMFLGASAHVDVRQVVIGAGDAFTGLAGDLRGDGCAVRVDASYLGAREQRRDFNYQLCQRGRATESDIVADGVLAGCSRKTLRGTIDFARGCKGSRGSETETVLIADDRVQNKTVPVILCGEDDVAGSHGATIGHVRPDQLFYLQSRGVSKEDSENLFIRAKLEDAALSAPDERIRASVERIGRALFEDFDASLERGELS